MVRSAELLLHERVPRRLVLQEPQAARADEALPDPELERPVGARSRRRRHAAAARRAARPSAVHHHGDPRRRRVQPLRGAGRHPLARRRDARQHRPVLLREGRDRRTGLVRRAPAGLRAGRPLPGAARHRPRHLRARRRRHRDPDGDRRGPGRRRRGAAGDGHQHGRHDARDRAHELRRDRARAARRRPRASRPSPISSSRPSGTSGVPRSPPPAVRARPTSGALWCVHVVATEQGAGRRRKLRDRPGAVRRPRAHDPGSRGARGRRDGL